MTDRPNSTRRAAFARLRDALAAMPRMSPQALLTFCAIAADEPVHMSELEEALGIGGSSVSRAIAHLGPWADGLGLIDAQENPQNRRLKIVRLTVKGRALAQSISAIVSNEQDRKE